MWVSREREVELALQMICTKAASEVTIRFFSGPIKQQPAIGSVRAARLHIAYQSTSALLIQSFRVENAVSTLLSRARRIIK